MDKDDLIGVSYAVLFIALVLGTLLLVSWVVRTDTQYWIAEHCDRRGEIVLEGYVYECTLVGRE